MQPLVVDDDQVAWGRVLGGSRTVLKLSRLENGEPEVFASLQGEGPTLGTPSVFVRLATCNLRCSWCDTAYTWDWARFDVRQHVLALSVEETAERALRTRLRNLVVTGGEPLLQQAALEELLARLRTAGLRIEVETNGTLRPSDRLAGLVDQWNVSPKLANSGNQRREREAPSALKWFAACAAAFFKFVIVDPPDVDEAVGLCDRYGVLRDRVVLMPEGIDAPTLQQRSAWLAERCQELGVRFSTRLHILLWGNQRGR